MKTLTTRSLRNLRQVLSLLLPIVLMAGWSTPALAVDAGQTSYTAELVCAYRALGARDPDPQTRNPDDLAQHFVNPGLIERMPYLGLKFDAAKVSIDMAAVGVFYYVNARTQHMDRLLRAALQEGAEQVVILGAGFDSRAYRFHQEFPAVRFFEVDLPATSQDKQQRVRKLLGDLPAWVTYAPIDFSTQTLAEVLSRAGFAADRKTFYVWEGVTYFIPEDAVDATLRFVAEQSAPGSQVVFDYMLEDVVQGADYSPYGARIVVFFVANRGEPYIFGIAPQRLQNFVNRRGLSLLSDLGPAELTQNYLIDSNGAPRGRIAEFLRIVHVRVPAKEERQQLKAWAETQGETPAVAHDDLTHRVPVPADVQQFFDRLAQAALARDLDALMANYSENYLHNGRTKPDVTGFMRPLQQRECRRYQVVLTRFAQSGDHAVIDGFVQREGFRTPLLVQDIARESDGRWRWYGNQR